MTGMPAISTAPAPADSSLASVIDYLSKNAVTDASVWNFLDRTDRVRLGQLLLDVDAVDAMVYDKLIHVGKSKKQFEAEKSAKKGKLFEQVAETLLANISCFGVRADISTATNQLDLLVALGPWSGVVPAFREWGTHFICECKFHDKGVAVDWVEKLHSILGTHGAKVGVLISKKPISKGTRGNINHLLQLFALNGKFVLSLSRADLDKCVAGEGIIQMLVDRYMAVQLGISYFLKPSI